MARWLAKAMLQKMLSEIPGGYKVNYALQVARNSHSQAIVEQRLPGLLEFIDRINHFRPIADSKILELGTGWNAINAVLFSMLGATQVIATDYSRHLVLEHLKKVLRAVRNQADRIATIRKCDSRQIVQEVDQLLRIKDEPSLLAEARITYQAPVDACHLGFGDSTFDLVYSWGVLAHFPEEELPRLAQETKRMLKKDGLIAHFIGLHDPYATYRAKDKVNFLRFSDRTWALLNSKLQSNNRLRASQHTKFYTDLGAEVLYVKRKFRQEALENLQKVGVDSKFSGLESEDLATHYYQLICRFSQSPNH